MMAFLLYDLRVAMLIAVFYVCYRLLLSRESLHELNRFLLLGTAIASFLLPLCVITVHHTELMASTPLPQITATAFRTAPVEATPWWHVALIVVFWTGFVISIA